MLHGVTEPLACMQHATSSGLGRPTLDLELVSEGTAEDGAPPLGLAVREIKNHLVP